MVARGWIHSDRQLGQRRDRTGRARRAEGLSTRPSQMPPAGSGRCARVSRLPGGQGQDDLIDLAGVCSPSRAARLRCRHQLEIFWDRLGWGESARTDVVCSPPRLDTVDRGPRRSRLLPAAAVPERARAARYAIEGTGQRWRDSRATTRGFGDVRDLLRNHRRSLRHHECRRRAAAPLPRSAAPAPASSATSWSSETAGSRMATTTPASRAPCCRCRPTGPARYDRAPRQLEDDPVYREHPEDFAEYHTRYVTTDGAREALRPGRPARRPAIPQP